VSAPVFKNARVVRSSWLQEDGRRLDCNPYMSGALEARDTLRDLKVRKEPLHSVTVGHNGGIYNGPKFARVWVDDPEYGVPFLGSSEVQSADLSRLPLLRREYAESKKLAHLELKRSTILITCSGTIGRMAYVRPDMEGIWSSQHIMKVVPDPHRIPPGYLYAFLSSRYGVPLIVSGTYGAIIQHIEPAHISGLPVPRLDAAKERAIAAKVDEAARARSEAVSLLSEAEARVRSKLGLERATPAYLLARRDWTAVESGKLLDRADAYYYSARNREARTAFDHASGNEQLGDVAGVFIPGIFKRLYASDPQFGSPYITGGDVFDLAPTSDKYLMRRVAAEYNLLLRKGMLVVQEAGQLGGLIGRTVMVGSYLDGFSCSNNMIRIVPEDDLDGGYLFVLLSSEFGVRLLSREAAGSSIPHTDEHRVKRLRIPWPSRQLRQDIGSSAIRARNLRDQACDLDRQAQEMMELEIGGGN
jgi:type I restriction enzyme, S subunit